MSKAVIYLNGKTVVIGKCLWIPFGDGVTTVVVESASLNFIIAHEIKKNIIVINLKLHLLGNSVFAFHDFLNSLFLSSILPDLLCYQLLRILYITTCERKTQR